ncbi:MAG: hypothetical protein IKU37_08720 [Candidatus Gastranaerophilales bacterium]|nr:hypothetical protein [Candidatus Gastranaerophilales bacterium]
MKKTIAGVVVGIALSAPILAKTIINPIDLVDTYNGFRISTTKITTDEGTYRIFIGCDQNGYGKGIEITAVKIK